MKPVTYDFDVITDAPSIAQTHAAARRNPRNQRRTADAEGERRQAAPPERDEPARCGRRSEARGAVVSCSGMRAHAMRVSFMRPRLAPPVVGICQQLVECCQGLSRCDRMVAARALWSIRP